jgi:cytochrome c-type biogenesis protein CcmF
MAQFGALTVLVAFVVATYAGMASLVGAQRRTDRLVDSGRKAVYLLAAVLGLSTLSMVYAFVVGDLRIKYVQHYSDSHAPLFYKISAVWGGLDGSMLFWVALLAVFSAVAVHQNRHRYREILPYVIAVLMASVDFFLYLIIYEKNPFDTFLTSVPAAGNGLNPLLQNPYMVTHPPALYAGFVGLAIPYAFAMGTLISGRLETSWWKAVRRTTVLSWLLLTLGLVLGMIWAYEELGWGGFWAWDPVENAGLLPWLTATALLHSAKVEERKQGMRIWNYVLAILTFFLTIFGTFMTRSGIVQSVHAFGRDDRLAIIFTVYMLLLLLVSFGFLLARLPALRAPKGFDSYLSREASFAAGNWVFVLATVVVMFATMFPTLSEALTKERVNVGPPFFNTWMVPIGIALLFLTGAGSVLTWRRTAAADLRNRLTAPLVGGIFVAGLCGALGWGRSKAALLTIGLCAFAAVAVVQEIVRALAARRRKGEGLFKALGIMLFRLRTPYAGYLVHLGIALMFVGFAGQAFQREETVVMAPGQEKVFGKYTLRFDGLSRERDPQKEMFTAELTVFENGQPTGLLRPARWFYDKRPNEPTTEVAIQRGFIEDLYVTMGNQDLTESSAGLKLVTNPLVDWMWLGFVVMALASLLLLLPEPRAAQELVASNARSGSRWTGLALPLSGAGAALVFGLTTCRLPWGAALVVLALEGLTMALAARWLYAAADPLLRPQTTDDEEVDGLIEDELKRRLAGPAAEQTP